jgi:CHC2 zinc finger
VNREALDELKQQIPLLDYLQAQDWQPVRPLSGGRWMGLCPLHADHKPSFLVDAGKSLFYCYGCGRGGDVIRFAEIYHDVKFPQALALLRQWRDLSFTHEDGWTTGGKPLLVDDRKAFLKRVEDKQYYIRDLDSVKVEMHGGIAITRNSGYPQP